MKKIRHFIKKYPFSLVCITLIWILSLTPIFPHTPLDNVRFIDKWVHILMYCGKEKNGDRQELHEHIRQHSIAAAEQVKLYGKANDLLDRILADPAFGLTLDELDAVADPSAFTGMAAQQVDAFLANEIRPLLEENAGSMTAADEITV